VTGLALFCFYAIVALLVGTLAETRDANGLSVGVVIALAAGALSLVGNGIYLRSLLHYQTDDDALWNVPWFTSAKHWLVLGGLVESIAFWVAYIHSTCHKSGPEGADGTVLVLDKLASVAQRVIVILMMILVSAAAVLDVWLLDFHENMSKRRVHAPRPWRPLEPTKWRLAADCLIVALALSLWASDIRNPLLLPLIPFCVAMLGSSAHELQRHRVAALEERGGERAESRPGLLGGGRVEEDAKADVAAAANTGVVKSNEGNVLSPEALRRSSAGLDEVDHIRQQHMRAGVFTYVHVFSCTTIFFLSVLLLCVSLIAEAAMEAPSGTLTSMDLDEEFGHGPSAR
jgi:hypothetical protein